WPHAVEHRWELVPVVVQDPVWERSFPDVGAITVPYADAETGRVVPVYLTRTEAARRRAEHEQRNGDLTLFFRSLGVEPVQVGSHHPGDVQDRKSTRLNSSHVAISYAVFCLKTNR